MKQLISVHEAEALIQQHLPDFGTEKIPLQEATGRILRSPITTDRDLPPYDRVTMDGIALRYEDLDAFDNQLRITGTQAAGDKPLHLGEAGTCIEIMTGAMLPAGADTIVRYEDLKQSENGSVSIRAQVTRGQNIHRKGEDSRKGTILVQPGTRIGPAEVALAASVGCPILEVSIHPRIAIISSGDEVVPVESTPEVYQIRSSNKEMLQSLLQMHNYPSTVEHLPDDKDYIEGRLGELLRHNDVLILTGGVSMGKYDYISDSLNALGVTELFHGVKQRPGKPFYFGIDHTRKTTVFALPGNPVSGFVCAVRYLLPWLNAAQGIKSSKKVHARLSGELEFKPSLTYFLPVSIEINAGGELIATPSKGKGSGDFSNLVSVDGFLELPEADTVFETGSSYPLWSFRKILK